MPRRRRRGAVKRLALLLRAWRPSPLRAPQPATAAAASAAPSTLRVLHPDCRGGAASAAGLRSTRLGSREASARHHAQHACPEITHFDSTTTPSLLPHQPRELEVVLSNFPPRSLESVVKLRSSLLTYADAYPVRGFASVHATVCACAPPPSSSFSKTLGMRALLHPCYGSRGGSRA